MTDTGVTLVVSTGFSAGGTETLGWEMGVVEVEVTPDEGDTSVVVGAATGTLLMATRVLVFAGELLEVLVGVGSGLGFASRKRDVSLGLLSPFSCSRR